MIKKISLITIIILLLTTAPAWALNSPTVGENSGVITFLFTNNKGLSLGWEYELTHQLALIGELNEPITKLGGKYQIQPNLAFLFGALDNSPFLGINGGHAITPNLTGIFELDLSFPDEEPTLFYKIGGILYVDQAIDIRTGLVGFLDDKKSPKVQLGIGCKF